MTSQNPPRGERRETFEDVEYHPDHLDPESMLRLINYGYFERTLRLPYRVTPPDHSLIGTVQKHNIQATLKSNERFPRVDTCYIVEDQAKPNIVCYSNEGGTKSKLSGAPTLARGVSIDTVTAKDGQRYHYYRWPNQDITVVGPARGLTKIYRIFSNYAAVATAHRILTAKLRRTPKPISGLEGVDRSYHKEHPTEWARVTTEYLDNKQYCRVKATHQNDHTVYGAFRRLADEFEWEHIPFKDLPEGEPVKITEWQFYKGPPKKPNTYLEDLSTGQTYLVTHREDALDPDMLPDISDDGEDHVEQHEEALGTGPGRWELAEVLHRKSGGYINATLWICCSEDRTILDRVVVKRFTSFDYAAAEINLHETLTRERNNYVIALRGFSRRYIGTTNAEDRDPAAWAPSESIRMYIEYADQGTLLHLLDQFKTNDRHVPEAFIWILLKNLIQACLLLERLGKVHPDLKPGNIFLLERQSEAHYPAYCIPVLGDFGLILGANEMINTVTGTLGWIAPEQMPTDPTEEPITYERPGRSPKKLHIYLIGLITWAVMRLRTSGLHIPAKCKGKDLDARASLPWQMPHPSGEARAPIAIQAPADPRIYSSRLERLLRDILVQDIAGRPTLESLAGRVNAGLRALENWYPGIETMSWEEMPIWFRFQVFEPEFIVGMNVEDQKRKRVDEVDVKKRKRVT